MTVGTCSIYLYTTSEYNEFGLESELKKCEDVCIFYCNTLKITPAVRLLFSLRINGTNTWVPPNSELIPNTKYEFRLRFKVPNLEQFKKLDKNGYNYYYYQVRNDFILSKIPEIEYCKHKSKIVGLAVADMYKDMIEKQFTIEKLEKNYKSYVPKEIVTKHPIFLKKTFATSLRQIKHTDYEPDYVKTSYLEQINKLAPNYLTEEYSGSAKYSDSDDDDTIRYHTTQRTCPVKIQFSPYHAEEPGLRIYYSYINTWKHISRVEDVYAIIIENLRITIEMKHQPPGFFLNMPNKESLESLVTCIAGYYRLMCRWTVDLCRELPTPSLKMLREIKSHGPIGGQFSYTKLKERNNVPGSYIIRQCNKQHNIYFIDMITRNSQPETFKVTKDSNKWILHLPNGTQVSDSLTELAKSIRTESMQKFRIAPSEYDKPPALLLCLPHSQPTANTAIENLSDIREHKAQCIDAGKELQLYKNSIKECNDGILTQMRADWKLPGNKKLEVTLKMLKPARMDYLPQVLKLANLWSKLNTSEILKLYGISLDQPIALVLESTKLGPFDEFLRHKSSMQPVCLIDAAYSLARALHYLQENNIVHGRVRCSSLHVVRYDAPNLLVVKLGDPGFNKLFSKSDKPWIAPEFHDNMEGVRSDMKAEIYAYATTLCEIFAMGKKPNEYQNSKTFPALKNCPAEIREIIKEGWDPDPDKRFSPQTIFARLITTKEACSHPYSSIPYHSTNGYNSGSRTSVVTNETEQTDIISTDSTVSDHSSSSIESHPAKFQHHSQNGGGGGGGGGSGGDGLISHDTHDFPFPIGIDHLEQISEKDDIKITFQGVIGYGHYGTVYRGQMESMNDSTIREIAIKQLTTLPVNDRNIMGDFLREIEIMKKLDHPNIVKIIDFIEEPQISIIMEFVKHRSFEMYVKCNSPSITNQSLLKFAKDIASGMEYLKLQRIVHRDLAARNILVDNDECVKISDFGLAQVAGENGYYKIKSTRDIPIKWYAPETLRTNKYSFESDVWSYGVTLYEMFSRGQQPDLIPGLELSMVDLSDQLLSGKRLQRPQKCPEQIYNQLLMPCWHMDPRKRPNFTQLIIEIDKLIPEYGECV